jgi:hypothetical protein
VGTKLDESRRIHDFVFQSRQPLVGLELKLKKKIGKKTINGLGRQVQTMSISTGLSPSAELS